MVTQALTGHAEAGPLKDKAVINPDMEPLDAAYGLSAEQATFFKREIGIENDDDLRTHILRVQEKAYEIFPYGCIRWLTFLQLGIAALPDYEKIIKLGQERPDGILLDIGCCFGVDARKVIADGFPLRNVVTTDLVKEFYGMGHTLFNTAPDSCPISFLAGDVFDPNILQIVPPYDKSPTTERPNLSTLTSLNPLSGHCTVIHASNIFHLFSEENQFHLAKALAGLLSPRPGSMICGAHPGNWTKGIFQGERAGKKFDVFQHSPESWCALWYEEVFPKGSVRVDTKLERVERRAASVMLVYLRLQWSVVRL